MLKSMTGYGRSVIDENGFTVTVEIKTLNSKQLDIYCRLPKAISNKELDIRTQLNTELERGKVELNLNIQRSADKEMAVMLNKPLIQAYMADLHATANDNTATISNSELLKIAVTLPNAYSTDNQQDGLKDAEWATTQKAINEAIQHCNSFRLREGSILADIFTDCITKIRQGLGQVAEQDQKRIPQVRERIKKALGDLLSDDTYDKNRFEQELIYYIEKYDISEEKQRLATHLDYFLEILNTMSNGKKLSFMAQELGREINTIGSKANDSAIQRIVVNMKDELEKIKEQTANVL
jgi:uncharacterized protein (TIGR00255 family)